ncbi:MAG: hypothetical protein AAFY60_03785, partial [Myxococcota bacterium]
MKKHLLIFVTALSSSSAFASTSPLIGASGFHCDVEVCGDMISAQEERGGYDAPFEVSITTPYMGTVSSEYKPLLFYVEVPAIDVDGPNNQSNTVPFVFEWTDLGVAGINQGNIDDICFDESGAQVPTEFQDMDGDMMPDLDGDGIPIVETTACDTGHVIRIYSPAYLTGGISCPPVEIPIEATPPPNSEMYENCQWAVGVVPGCSAGTECCRALDNNTVGLSVDDLVAGGFLAASCVGPGVWKVEMDYSESGRLALATNIGSGNEARETEPGGANFQDSVYFNDIDIFTFAAYQAPREEPPGSGEFFCDFPNRNLRVFTNALNLASDPTTGALDATVLTDVRGGWLTSIDVAFNSLEVGFDGFAPSEPPIRLLQVPGQPAFDLVSAPGVFFPQIFSLEDTTDLASPPDQGGQMGWLFRTTVPFTWLSEADPPTSELFGGVSGYPFPVSNVDTQGLWAINVGGTTNSGVPPGALTTVSVRAQEEAITELFAS